MTRVLIVEDEESLADPLAFLLRKEGFETTIAGDGPSALAEFDREGADIVLLDLMLPGMSGTDVCKQLRTRSGVPVIMVTARDSEIDKVVGLELGADDYVTKPYSARELIARIRAVLRRGADTESEVAADDGLLEAGPVRMDVDRHVVHVNGEPVAMPLKEFDLLEYLLRNSGGCSPADSSSTGCGAPTTSATPRPSTSTSSVCARRSRRILPSHVTS